MPSPNKATIRQVDPGVYQDESGYWTGSWDNPQYRGTQYGGGGASGTFGTRTTDTDGSGPPPSAPSTNPVPPPAPTVNTSPNTTQPVGGKMTAAPPPSSGPYNFAPGVTPPKVATVGNFAPGVTGDKANTLNQPTPGGTDAVSLIRQYQATHPAAGGAGLDDLVNFLKQNGINASRFSYNGTPSNNELDFGQGKYKVFSEGNGTWYQGGDDSGGQGPSGPTTKTNTAPPGTVQTPEGTYIVSQIDPGLWQDNKGQQWYLGPDGKPMKVGGVSGGPTPGGPTGPTFGNDNPPPQPTTGPSSSNTGMPAATPTSSAFNQQVRDLLMQHLKEAGTPVDENSAEVAQPLSAARDESARAMQGERTALAERLYAQGSGNGLDTNALNQGIQQSAERNATGLSGIRASLISNAVARKASQLQQDLQMAMSSGDNESARSISLQLAALQKQLGEEGMGVDMAKYQAYLNYLASAGMTGGA